MSTKSTPKAQDATPDATVKAMRASIEWIDNLSQDAFSEISTIAKLALTQLETPDGYRHTSLIANALKLILGRAEDTENLINAEAENYGCNHIDDAERRRMDAQRVYLEGARAIQAHPAQTGGAA